jgi:NMD protein affecting ribosome stability and mRNA decay
MKQKRCCSNCGNSIDKNLFALCNKCRAQGCKHPASHYNSGLAKICDDCGTVIAGALRTMGINKSITTDQKRTSWQQHGGLIGG